MTTKLLLNVVSGQVVEADEDLLTHEHFKQFYTEVPGGTKSYEPDKYKGYDNVDQYLKSHKKVREFVEDAPAPDGAPADLPAPDQKDSDA